MPTSFRSRLLAHEKLIGLLITLPSPEVAEICVNAGFDWLFLDMEHGLLDVPTVQRIAQAVGDRAACVVRVPSHDPVWITKVLDLGVDGLIVPQVNTAEEAAAVVRAAKYPPQGARSVGLARAHGYGATFAEYVRTANENTAIIIQTEHINAVQNIDSILEIPGLDAAFIGPFDLSASLNKTGQITDSEVQAAIDKVRTAAQSRRFPLGIFAPTLERAQQALADGYTLLAVSADISLLTTSAKQLRSAL
jgi:2-dehydro-3-deoxyglucarate aldolase/4-hydroxy-2-oxoheptanedioate aldolase